MLPKNVILFGETGCGKSSIVNMLADEKYSIKAKVGDTANGVTFETTCYIRQIDGQTYNIYDTAGLSEATGGTVTPQAAIRELYALIRRLHGGINLLILATRGPRITNIAQNNYKAFYEIFCDSRVPIIFLVTHMEKVVAKGQDAWSTENQAVITQMGLSFEDRACITADPGDEGALEKQYETSKDVVKELIKDHCSDNPLFPFVGEVPWLKKTIAGLYNQFAPTLNWNVIVLDATVYQSLLELKAFKSDVECRAAVNEIVSAVEQHRREIERKEQERKEQEKKEQSLAKNKLSGWISRKRN